VALARVPGVVADALIAVVALLAIVVIALFVVAVNDIVDGQRQYIIK
jgi:hypothetical protein